MSYDFSNLNDKDLEELTLDILSKMLNLKFQSFKMGKDKGIDLRISALNNDNEIIVQVKHFLNSGVSKLKSELKNKELEKVKSLNPTRYILVTSLPLTPNNKEDIKIILSPFIQTTNDILGNDELNYYLREYPQIVENHFKLWLSGTAVLGRIINNGIKGRSEFIEAKIRERIKIFVPNKAHNSAVSVLNNHHFILITGSPGIGKTTLANILTYQLLAEEFELIFVKTVEEADLLFHPERKQVFYFDDFLGSITLDLFSSKNADSELITFIERVKSDKSKRLILTCRTNILNQAKEESEKITNSKIDISNHEVKIQDYRDIDKARILYSHIFISKIPDTFKSIFFQNSFYWTIIKHKHYNPRIIEFLTDIDRLQLDSDYETQVLSFLKDPSKIWEKSYTKQISENGRMFLATLFSLGGRYVINEQRISDAYDGRLTYETKFNNYVRKSGTFTRVVNELLKAFIRRDIVIEKKYTSIEYRFFNPSIEDFLTIYLSQNIDEYFIVLKSAVSFHQFKFRITTDIKEKEKKIYFGERHYANLLKITIEKLTELESSYENNKIFFVIILLRLFKWNDVRTIVTEKMNSLKVTSLGWDDRDDLIEILQYISTNNLLEDFNFSLEEMFVKLTYEMGSSYQIEAFSSFINDNEVYKKFLTDIQENNQELFNIIQDNIDKSWEEGLDFYFNGSGNLNNIIEEDELIERANKLKNDAKRINEKLNLKASPIINNYEIDFKSILHKNMVSVKQKEVSIKEAELEKAAINEPLEINRLFNSPDNSDFDDLPF